MHEPAVPGLWQDEQALGRMAGAKLRAKERGR